MTNELRKYFDAERRAVGRARECVIASLLAWGVTGEPAEDIRLCVSELATNALAHGTRRGHGFLVCLYAEGKSVHLEVHDSRDLASDRRPRLREAALTDTAGRGLSLVDTLADAWGVHKRLPYGKVVWSRFEV
ncbi:MULTISPECIES: ATP-binding protein [Streptomyces]|uniref:ATP-binding protein n=1 Tax=Streptomyces koyangensis TaxID=188770 RepID=A0A385DC18_9ACTN|nr:MULTISPECIES: ATP-binding protein [Streptomyces]AXQ55935.1 ATP-binding protein [Streptomyces koyangensis]PKR46985.1 ATP-binding protein [Streptomyces sp. EAG2]WTD04101.1 ATP-binding protein [Streptomyces albidoflavus]